jgi:hypothetical protein
MYREKKSVRPYVTCDGHRELWAKRNEVVAVNYHGKSKLGETRRIYFTPHWWVSPDLAVLGAHWYAEGFWELVNLVESQVKILTGANRNEEIFFKECACVHRAYCGIHNLGQKPNATLKKLPD